MSEFKKYRRNGITEMRPYVLGEDLSKVSVSSEDFPEEGGWIARSTENHNDQWYVGKEYFLKMEYVEVTSE